MRRRRGFTLLELIVATTIMAIAVVGPDGELSTDPFDLYGAHLPSNFGSRFSRKAVMPSTRSSVAIASS